MVFSSPVTTLGNTCLSRIGVDVESDLLIIFFLWKQFSNVLSSQNYKQAKSIGVNWCNSEKSGSRRAFCRIC